MKFKPSVYFRPAMLITGMAFLILSCGKQGKYPSAEPPVAEKVEKMLVIHGDTRIDPYYWMRLSDEQKSAKEPGEQTRRVLEYLEAENTYKEAMLAHTEELQEKIFEEIVGRIKQDDASVPYFENGYYYYTRYEEGKEYPFYCRRKGSMDSPEEIMLDVNRMAEGHDFYSVTGLSVSPDNRLLAFADDTVGRRRYTLRFKNLETGEMLADEIPNTSGGTWASDNSTVFYTGKNLQTLRAERIMKHVLGTDVASDREVYFEDDETFSCRVFKTKSKKYLMIASTQTLSTEYRYLDAGNPEGDFRVIQPRRRDLEYYVDHFGDHFYIRTNAGGAKNFKLVKTPVTRTTLENWTDVIPHRPDVLLEGFELFTGFLVVDERLKGLTNLRVISWDGATDYSIDFGEEAYSARISVNPEFDTETLRYSYSSLVTPNSVYDFNMRTREKTLRKQDEVLGGYDPAKYEVKRLFARAQDGTEIPISMVHPKGMKPDGNNPLLLYGYGSYGSSMDAGFRSSIISLLDRGVAYAIAHIRGGSEMGQEWYEDGKLLNKMNTFTDFNDCAAWLIENRYTGADKLFAMGGSAGGLLIGAVINLRPELYRGVIASVPFVDVVTTMLDESIPLTTFEYDEWGNPNDSVYYRYMLSYSPYDNVQAMDYPHILVTTGYWDSQVQYWEPAKWVAKLRDMKTDNNLLLFHINMDAGHGGQSGRFRRYRETAMEYAFMLDLLGIEE
ncbi:MAG TPA: S9 family peptidase [Bacteroidetes bacterium]|nr:S9 family peptidase [Bacteroidota bacterium]